MEGTSLTDRKALRLLHVHGVDDTGFAYMLIVRTGFDVAFTESKATKASDRLLALRTMEYEGEDVDLLWHVKWGTRPPRLLRVCYHPDPRRKLPVIGWFGDHLETAGTRRM